jgi:N-acetylneuraminate lyase
MRDRQRLATLRGVCVAFNTPFDSRGDVAPQAARTLARSYRNRSVDGLYLCGSSGEGIMMRVEERKALLEAVFDEVGRDMTIIVHVGAAATRDSVELAAHSAELGVHAISAVPSVYYRLSEREIREHWLTILKPVELPFIIYNIPGTTGYNITAGLFADMAAVEQVYGIKNSNMNAYQIMQFRKAAGADFVIYNGPDEQYLAGRVMGADGGIGGSYGVMPELFVALEKAIREKDLPTAGAIQNAVNEIIPQMYALASFCGASKEIIRQRFCDIGEPRLPQAPLAEGDRRAAKKIAKQIEDYVARFG